MASFLYFVVLLFVSFPAIRIVSAIVIINPNVAKDIFSQELLLIDLKKITITHSVNNITGIVKAILKLFAVLKFILQ